MPPLPSGRLPGSGPDESRWNWSNGQPPPGHGVDVAAIAAGTWKSSPTAATWPYAFVHSPDGRLFSRWSPADEQWYWTEIMPPRGRTVTGAMATVSVKNTPRSVERPYAFMRASDGHLWAYWWNTSRRWLWSDLGTPPNRSIDAGAIAAIAIKNGSAAQRPQVFIRASDGHLWLLSWTGSAWQWSDLGTPPGRTVDIGAIGALGIKQSPSAPELPNVFVRGSDARLWRLYRDGAAWTWQDHGAPPSLTVDAGAIGVTKVKNSPGSQERQYAFVRASDGRVWQRYWIGWKWIWVQPYQSPDTKMDVGALAAVTVRNIRNAGERPFVYARGTDGHLWVNVCCSGWEDLGKAEGNTVELGAIGAVTVKENPAAPPRPLAFVRASDGNLWVNWRSGLVPEGLVP
jgi:hypothetical protein